MLKKIGSAVNFSDEDVLSRAISMRDPVVAGRGLLNVILVFVVVDEE